MSNLFRSTTIKGTRITDFSQTSARVGDPIPFGYGTFPVDGNVIWAPLPPKEHVAKKRQGKGGVKQETFTYTLSYAICFCRGEIFNYLWIKRNGKVVYTTDPAAPIEDQSYAAKWAEKATFYYGDGVQLPDSTIEAYEGVGNVSAFRRDAYIVVEDDDVTEGGGAVPTYEACVVRGAARSYTTPPYPVYNIDSVSTGSVPADGKAVEMPLDELTTASYALDGQLRDTLQQYEYQESLNTGSYALNGILRTPLVFYTYYPPEAVNTSSFAMNGTLKTVLIPYLNYPPESLDASSYALNGTLT